MARETTSKFIKVKCKDCGNEQVVFNKPSTTVKCNVCSAVMVEPQGGLGRLVGELVSEVQ
ncbi:MAG TPA: 30S ribosomal protein S27e [Candidatus Thermoplasmatota archaeon]|nr:30S ribosomal protein S27e [Candidatus Thermoplasmatota archaeon]